MSAGDIPTATPPAVAAPDLVEPTRWIEGAPSLHRITTDIAQPLEARPGRGWWICFGIAGAAVLNLLGMVSYLFAKGIGIWGLNNAVGWAFYGLVTVAAIAAAPLYLLTSGGQA